MKMILSTGEFEQGKKFYAGLKTAFIEAGIAKELWYGYLVGFIYGQFRQTMSKEEARAAFDAVLAQLENQFDESAPEA
jgi:hypothetical protein